MLVTSICWGFLPETTFAVVLPEHSIVVSPSLQATILLPSWEKVLTILVAQRDLTISFLHVLP